VSDGRELVVTRTPELASVVARFLDGEEIPRREVDDPSPYRRYTTGRDPRDSTRTVIYAAPSTVRHPSAFGDGTIARTDDANLAERVMAMLNDTDPDYRRKATRGFGWW
jgi:hypothetical protein